MKPMAFDASGALTGHGYGNLTDAISCTVTEELNGRCDLEMKYPVDGVHYGDLALRCLIKAPKAPGGTLQPFRIYRITTPINGVVTVYARHLVYDLDGIPVLPFSATTAAETMQKLVSRAAVPCSFTLWTNLNVTYDFTVTAPTPLWGLLGASTGGVLATYGGEYEFDGSTVKLWQQRGQSRGVKIKYGVNLTTLEQDRNIADLYTGVLPYWSDTDSMVTGSVVSAAGTFGYTRILPVDFSSEFDSAPTTAQLTTAAQTYITKNKIGVPEVSLTVSFVQLSQTDEYKDKPFLDTVALGDTVTVEFAKLGISSGSRVVATEYDVLLDRFSEITLGSPKATVSRTIAKQAQQLKQAITAPEAERISRTLTQIMMGLKGGAIRMLDDNDLDGYPDELYVGNNADPSQATYVWRWNYMGLGGSKNGYAGPYTIGLYFDDNGNATIDAEVLNVKKINISEANRGTLNTLVAGLSGYITAPKTFAVVGGGGTVTGAQCANFETTSILSSAGSAFFKGGQFVYIGRQTLDAYVDARIDAKLPTTE